MALLKKEKTQTLFRLVTRADGRPGIAFKRYSDAPLHYYYTARAAARAVQHSLWLTHQLYRDEGYDQGAHYIALREHFKSIGLKGAKYD